MPEPAARQGGLELQARAEELWHELAGPIQRIPRSHRYRTGADLEDQLRHLVDLVIEAASSGQPSRVYRLHEQTRKVEWRLAAAAKQGLLRPAAVGRVSRPPVEDDPRDRGGTLYQIKAMVGAWRERVKSKG
ncbi:hypothetical protein SAMN05660831_02102 [Thiohalospira halophila DSM 15071]|uniref:Uncharacterized protein n=1 Tax=Thiohalospira halophila DSM 15071 TaxID=1123397 RepID=A0A1I1UBU3_9GAMM|nr:four helix bundle protein [Thiohalospira halophila]SFD68302.1 hypothetical protein SAMN05660831_02102 [Thiohalospira halophila DSM 15071]